ncbi:MAG: sugar phosphate isomerase/epimerase [Clostridiales bacterium]|nr:sugar phosphate isomerase/epimerase [Clostridiales bacterium]
MKLSCSTITFDGWPIERVGKLCAANGITALEIRTGLESRWSSLEMSEQEAAELKSTLAQYGMVVSNLGSAVAPRGYEAEQLPLFAQNLRLARLLGTSAVRIFLGNFPNHPTIPYQTPDDAAIIKFVRECCGMAAQQNAEVWIETHNEYSKGSVLRGILDGVNLPNLKIIWDIIHPLEEGEEVGQTLATIGGDIAHVHLKDGVPNAGHPEYIYTDLGDGELPIAQIVAALQARGYGGYYSLEWEDIWKDEIRHLTADLVIPKFATLMAKLK